MRITKTIAKKLGYALIVFGCALVRAVDVLRNAGWSLYMAHATSKETLELLNRTLAPYGAEISLVQVSALGDLALEDAPPVPSNTPRA